MSASYQVYKDHNLLYVRYAGHHATRQTNDLLPYYRLDPDVRPGLRCVIDCTRLINAKVDIEERRKQMAALRALLKHPADDWQLTYYCPNSVSQSLTSLQQKMWREFDGVDFKMATTFEELASILRHPDDFLRAMLGPDD
jgi:hypothetical protein